MKKITTWKPDTCECVLRLEWDTEQPAETRVHSAAGGTPCAAHAAVGDVVAVADAVKAENRGKNQSLAALLAHAPDLKPEDVAFRFAADRSLVLTAPKLGARKSAARAALAAAGFGKVTVE